MFLNDLNFMMWRFDNVVMESVVNCVRPSEPTLLIYIAVEVLDPRSQKETVTVVLNQNTYTSLAREDVRR